VIANLLKYTCAKYWRNRCSFHISVAKIKLQFLPHTVDVIMIEQYTESFVLDFTE